MGRPKESTDVGDTTVLYIRGTPVTLARKVRAGAALVGKGVPTYVIELLQSHITELERKGILPKAK